MKLFILSLVVASNVLLQAFCEKCDSSGFRGCECNFLGACDSRNMPVSGLDDELTGYAPNGIEQFQYSTTKNPPNLASLCEGGFISILFDCNAKIALYAATVITVEDFKRAGFRTQKTGWKTSSDKTLSPTFQQASADYINAENRNLCYENAKGDFATDIDWFKAKNFGQIPQYECAKNFEKHVKSPMTRGHLIPSSYAKGNQAKIDASFTLTNAVPQFGAFNNGPWSTSEQKLLDWGKKNCAPSNAPMFVVVGTIPSTFGNSPNNPRFFGASGFSEFEGFSKLTDTYLKDSGKKEYRINVPKFMWTAACCKFNYLEASRWQIKTKSAAFYRSNDPGSSECYEGTPAEMMTYFKYLWPEMTIPTLFPQNENC